MGELDAVGHALGGKIAVHNATAAQVGSFGSITRAVQIYATPTILIVNTRGVGEHAHRPHRRVRDRAGDRRSAHAPDLHSTA